MEETMSDEAELADVVEFAENPEPRCPCVLLLDTSGSMQGEKIEALNQGLRTFKDDLRRDALAVKRVEVAVVTFDSEVRAVQDFVTVDQFEPPTLAAQGQTFMGSAIHQALDLIETRKELYRTQGIDYYRPWVFMITDGEPQGEPGGVVQQAARRVKADEEAKHVVFFAVGVGNANMTRLDEIAVRTPVKLRGLDFVEMFIWLSRSMGAVASSQTTDDQVALPPPGWTVT
jgi:uncharacterized protein YegL